MNGPTTNRVGDFSFFSKIPCAFALRPSVPSSRFLPALTLLLIRTPMTLQNDFLSAAFVQVPSARFLKKIRIADGRGANSFLRRRRLREARWTVPQVSVLARRRTLIEFVYRKVRATSRRTSRGTFAVLDRRETRPKETTQENRSRRTRRKNSSFATLRTFSRTKS